MRTKVSIAPAIKPVSLDELKRSLRITHASEDLLLESYLDASVDWAQRVTGRKFITQTLVSYTSQFSYAQEELWWSGVRQGAFVSVHPGANLELDFGPAQSITQIDTINLDNVESVYGATNYYLDNFDNDRKPKIVLNQGAATPSNLRAENSIKITWVAGYGDNACDVPAGIRQAIINLSGFLYANRGDCTSSSGMNDAACSCGAQASLSPYIFQSV